MTIGLTYNGTLSRVQIALSDLPDGTVQVQRVANAAATEALWARGVVRGGVALPIVGGTGNLDDFEFFADVENFYRVVQNSTEDNVTVFTSSGTWNKPGGLVAVRVTVVGPGGGGGGVPALGATTEAAEGGGGGYGAIAMAWIPAADLGATESVTVPTGGAGGAAGANPGTAGGTATFTRTTGIDVSAAGGGGGAAGANTTGNNQSAGGAGGTATTGADVSIPGEFGYYGTVRGGLASFGGRGGSGLFGPGGRTTHSFDTAGTPPAGGFGGGGSGARNDQTTAVARAGGTGAGGLVIVEHFFDQVTV